MRSLAAQQTVSASAATELVMPRPPKSRAKTCQGCAKPEPALARIAQQTPAAKPLRCAKIACMTTKFSPLSGSWPTRTNAIRRDPSRSDPPRSRPPLVEPNSC